ncbi:MAG TPA: YugN family protein [Bacillota bacterium]|nr:YugN family protein [Bacillota bacterium]
MIPIQSNIVGKQAIYGEIKEPFESQGFVLGGNWDYDGGFFDTILEKDGAETIFLRLPIEAVDGNLNEPEAQIKFGQPLLVRHVVQGEIASDSLPLIDQMPYQTNAFVNQFQTPVETDGEIRDQRRREEMARQAIKRIKSYICEDPR